MIGGIRQPGVSRYRNIALPVLLAITAAGGIGLVVLLGGTLRVPYGNLTRDIVDIARLPLYIGFLSQVGLWLWAGTAAICLFSGFVLPRRSTSVETYRFLLAAGLISLFLGLDDTFTLHEDFYPEFGILEGVLYLFYIAVVAGFILRFRRAILAQSPGLFAIALGGFALSVMVDAELLSGLNDFLIEMKWNYLVEDSLKFVGLVCWAGYFFRRCCREFGVVV